jgi:hypothetical protein
VRARQKIERSDGSESSGRIVMATGITAFPRQPRVGGDEVVPVAFRFSPHPVPKARRVLSQWIVYHFDVDGVPWLDRTTTGGSRMGGGLSIQFVASGKHKRRLHQRVWATSSAFSDITRSWPGERHRPARGLWKRRTLVRMESWVSRKIRSFIML